LDRVARLGKARGDRLDANRAATEVAGDHAEIAAVEAVEAERVDLKAGQGRISYLAIDDLGAGDGGEVADTAEQAAGNAWCATRTAGNLDCAVLAHRQAEDARATADDLLQLLNRIELKPGRNAETVAERVGQQAKARRCGH